MQIYILSLSTPRRQLKPKPHTKTTTTTQKTTAAPVDHNSTNETPLHNTATSNAPSNEQIPTVDVLYALLTQTRYPRYTTLNRINPKS